MGSLFFVEMRMCVCEQGYELVDSVCIQMPRELIPNSNCVLDSDCTEYEHTKCGT